MITVTALKRAPPFASGQVRDHHVRWILNEVSWTYNVLDVAMRAGRFIGAEGTADRAAAIQWVVAGLNSVEPFLLNVAEVDYFMDDEAAKATRRPVVVAQAKDRLAMLEQAREGREWFVGDAFSVADLMIASILKIERDLDLLIDLPALAAWQQSVLIRPAHVKADQDQKAEIARHSPADMRYDAVPKEMEA